MPVDRRVRSLILNVANMEVGMEFTWKVDRFPRTPDEKNSEFIAEFLKEKEEELGVVLSGGMNLTLIRLSPVALRQREFVGVLTFAIGDDDMPVFESMSLLLRSNAMSFDEFWEHLDRCPLGYDEPLMTSIIGARCRVAKIGEKRGVECY